MSAPSFDVINPYPFSGSNHFTIPSATLNSFLDEVDSITVDIQSQGQRPTRFFRDENPPVEFQPLPVSKSLSQLSSPRDVRRPAAPQGRVTHGRKIPDMPDDEIAASGSLSPCSIRLKHPPRLARTTSRTTVQLQA